MAKEREMKKVIGQTYRVLNNDMNGFEIGDIVMLTNVFDNKCSKYTKGRLTQTLNDIDHEEPHVELVEEATEEATDENN